jgi:LysM repeat protein
MKRSLIVAVLLVAILILGVTAVSAQSRTYIVGAGDVLDLIAAYFNVDPGCIVAATPGLNPRLLYPGQQLVIPTQCAPYYGGSWGNGRIKGRFFPIPAPVPPPPGDQGGGGTYLVRPGDQLAWIARYYGVSMQCLMNVNGIRNPNLIYAGTRLAILPCQSPVVGLPNTPPNTPPVNQPATTHTVQPGDRLSDIAQRYGADLGCLVRVNALANQNLIRRGQVLQIGPCLGQGGGQVSNQNYTVQPGDRLSNIAATFQIEVHCLIESNNIGNPNHIEAGDVLVIDYSACGASG